MIAKHHFLLALYPDLKKSIDATPPLVSETETAGLALP
jgi:hypothetical protein